jgi:hypothetical protein
MGRILGLLGVVVAMAIGLYVYSSQVKTMQASPTSDPATAANITGVKTDLLSIANAERGYLAQEGHYASLDELVGGKYLTISGSRPPYVYDVETDNDGFRVTATRSGPGSPAKIWVDQTMEVQSSE